jgi:hypothetical protein
MKFITKAESNSGDTMGKIDLVDGATIARVPFGLPSLIIFAATKFGGVASAMSGTEDHSLESYQSCQTDIAPMELVFFLRPDL